jgi:UDP-N-acetylmuramoyl-tripeptide--D-alanyl-D-alanine ligase
MMSLSLLADKLQAKHHGSDAVFTGVSTDTRALAPGDLFVALTGPRFDGHGFLPDAIAAGAAGALLGHALDTPLPYVEVPDTRQALGSFAALWRAQFKVPVVAVTGSNGKTTVKEMLAAILACRGKGCVTRGNLNNDIGVPLTLLRLRADDGYAVIEMGMNRRGEIGYLAGLTRPTIALITNAAEAHLAGLGSVEEVARAKGEIFTGLADGGTAVINADDAYRELWKTLVAPRRVLTFGLEHKADVRADYALGGNGCTLRLMTPAGDIDVRLSLLGKHNVMNALGATAAALAAGAAPPDVKAGLETVKAVAGRLELKEGIGDARVIDDTYNANPASLAAGLQVLRDFPGERALVLGDMAELGPAAEDVHRRAGALARHLGIQRLFALGELSRHAVEAFGRGARHFDGPEALADALRNCLHGEITVLVKGSRVMRMERVVAGITRPTAANGRTR